VCDRDGPRRGRARSGCQQGVTVDRHRLDGQVDGAQDLAAAGVDLRDGARAPGVRRMSIGVAVGHPHHVLAHGDGRRSLPHRGRREGLPRGWVQVKGLVGLDCPETARARSEELAIDGARSSGGDSAGRRRRHRRGGTWAGGDVLLGPRAASLGGDHTQDHADGGDHDDACDHDATAAPGVVDRRSSGHLARSSGYTRPSRQVEYAAAPTPGLPHGGSAGAPAAARLSGEGENRAGPKCAAKATKTLR
jgi:hypothetical protein